jgi:hypothetical protein
MLLIFYRGVLFQNVQLLLLLLLPNITRILSYVIHNYSLVLVYNKKKNAYFLDSFCEIDKILLVV